VTRLLQSPGGCLPLAQGGSLAAAAPPIGLSRLTPRCPSGSQPQQTHGATPLEPVTKGSSLLPSQARSQLTPAGFTRNCFISIFLADPPVFEVSLLLSIPILPILASPPYLPHLLSSSLLPSSRFSSSPFPTPGQSVAVVQAGPGHCCPPAAPACSRGTGTASSPGSSDPTASHLCVGLVTRASTGQEPGLYSFSLSADI